MLKNLDLFSNRYNSNYYYHYFRQLQSRSQLKYKMENCIILFIINLEFMTDEQNGSVFPNLFHNVRVK